MKKHENIALFVNHIGCPHICSFCNQHVITGQQKRVTSEDIDNAVNTALEHGFTGGQLAFFGGSFTAVSLEYMLTLLNAAYPYVKNGTVTGIRISTRPDAINSHILDILEEYGVESIELGAQSMVDRVLEMNHRGHTAEDVVKASELIKSRGFELGLQMMTGLYGDSFEGTLESADRIIVLQPATVRIYPAIVLENTELAELSRKGIYRPQTLDEAVTLGAELINRFEGTGIQIIRMGLHSGGGVDEGYVAGPYHPAFRELCEGELYLSRAEELLFEKPEGKYILRVAPSEISKMTGQKRKNILKLKDKGYQCKVKSDDSLSPYEILVGVE